MYTESRKAARNSLAHHRAYLLFSPRSKGENDSLERRGPTEQSKRRAIVRNGLLGYLPAAAL